MNPTITLYLILPFTTRGVMGCWLVFGEGPSEKTMQLASIPEQGTESLNVRFKVPKASDSDWITLYPKGKSPSADYIAYSYNGNGKKKDTLELDLSGCSSYLEAGQIYHIGYLDVDTERIVGDPVTLEVVKAVATPGQGCKVIRQGEALSSLALAKHYLPPSLEISFSVPKASDYDYVVIYPMGKSGANDYLTYEYNAKGTKTGTVRMSGVSSWVESGEAYEIGYLDNGSNKVLGETVKLQVL